MITSFADLAARHTTGKAVVLSGTGKDRVMGYRSGVQCNAGDLEKDEWKRRVLDLVEQAGEQKLFEQMLSYVKENFLWCRTTAEREMMALELHANRIFDNEMWVGYIRFNQRYRPEVLKSAAIAWIQTDCCRKPGMVTQARLEKDSRAFGVTCCPHCGIWSPFELVTGDGRREG